MKWTEDEDRLLRTLRDKGLTMLEISSHFPGRTRCSIIGRYHRLEGEKKTYIPVNVKIKTEGLVKLVEIEEGPIGEYEFHQIAGEPMCRWPLGRRDGKQFWCGRPTDEPYCETHKALSVSPTQIRRDRPLLQYPITA